MQQMAGILGRITRVFGSSDDPQPTDPLQNSYGQQTQLLQEVRRGAAEVATSCGSSLLADVFGAAGVHAWSVVGVDSLRNGVPLTLRAVVEVKPG
mgnify:CR=1 FL=1